MAPQSPEHAGPARGQRPPSGPHVGIVTLQDDFHADVVALRLRQSGARVSIFALDALPSGGRLSWWLDPSPAGLVANTAGERIRPADLDVLWWRRNGMPQAPPEVTDPDACRVIAHDARAAALGLFATSFSGAWVSEPEATRRADNKLVQLQAAQQAGLRLPRTLVSQEPDDIRAFAEALGGSVIAKTVAGAPDVPLQTALVDLDALADSRSLAVCPAIYQELVPGDRHLRVCCFGDEVHAVEFASPALDWRYVPGLRAVQVDLDPALCGQLIAVLRLLDLRMGMFDLKVSDDGPPVWLEVNPQGQFLFLEGMCGIPLARIAADFLIAEAGRSVRRDDGAARRDR